MANTLAACKKELSELKTPLAATNGFKPVIVKTEYAKNKFNFGVQYWSDFAITRGNNRNNDNTMAYLVEMV